MARLFAAGNESVVEEAIKRLIGVRLKRRQETVGDADPAGIQSALSEAGLDEETVEAIYKLTSLPTREDRFVVPPYHREMAIEMMEDPLVRKQTAGVGRREAPARGP
jgi:nitrate reductase beta subunit